MRIILENNIAGVLVEETSDGDSVIEILQLQENEYDLLVLDINMPGINTVDLVGKILELDADARILIFSMNPDIPFAKIYLKMGVAGYLTKTSSPDEIIKAIYTVLAGKIYASDKVQAALQVSQAPVLANPFESLSPREFEIMLHVLRGETVKEICQQSGLSSSTVSTYKARVYEKLGTRNIMEIISLANAHHILKD